MLVEVHTGMPTELAFNGLRWRLFDFSMIRCPDQIDRAFRRRMVRARMRVPTASRDLQNAHGCFYHLIQSPYNGSTVS